MNELLKNDFTVRTISLLFAVLLWFFVLDNSANPFTTTYLTIPLKIENESSLEARGLGLKDKNYQKTIILTVKGRKNTINNLRPDDFEAILDFSKVREAGEREISIDGPFTSVKGVAIEDVRHKTVMLQVEKVVKNSYRVETIMEGTPKQNYKILKISVNPESPALQGLESLMKSVDKIKTWVDINNLDKDLTINKKECKVYNKNGVEIPELSRNLTVDIMIEVAKEVSVTPIVKGRPAKNHTEGAKRVSPERLLITGSPDILAQTSDLRTETIDIENATESMDVRKALILPNGVRLVNTPSEVIVNVAILKPVRKEFVINKENISILNSEPGSLLKYDILSKSITVAINSTQTEIDKLDPASFKPSVDVAKLTEGTYKVSLHLSLPASVSLQEDYKVEVKIEKEQKIEAKADKDTIKTEKN